MESALKSCLIKNGYEPSAELLRLRGLCHENLNQPLQFRELPIELAFKGGARAIQAFVACGADPNAINGNGLSVLAEAVHYYAGPEVVKALLDAGANPGGVHRQGAQRYPPLEWACDRDWRVIPTLIRAGADPNGAAPIRPIYKAISSRHGLKPIILLIAHGANPELPCVCEYRPIELATLENQWKEVDFLLGLGVDTRKLRADINLAASAGLETAVKRCLTKGTAVDTPDHLGRTPIVNAIASRRARTAALLLKAGADVQQHVRWMRRAPPGLSRSVAKEVRHYFSWDDERDWRDGWTLLELAADSGDIDSLTYLLLRDATPRARNLALLTACANAQDDCVDLLLQFGADPNFGDMAARSALAIAAQRGISLGRFVAAGADVHVIDEDGAGLLHWVGYSGDGRIVQEALKWCKEVDVRDKQGNTPLMTAAYHGSAEVVETLLDAGSDRSLRNESGETALDIAASQLEQAHLPEKRVGLASERAASAYICQLLRKRPRRHGPKITSP